jgi:phage-related protein
MSTRTYDYKLTLENAAFFQPGRFLLGNTSETIGEIISQDLSNDAVKVKVSNTFTEYKALEYVHCNNIITATIDAVQYYSNSAATVVNGRSYTINGSTNTFALPLTSRDGETTIDFNKVNPQDISVTFDSFPVNRSQFVYPSTNNTNGLGNAGFDMKPVTFIPGDGLISVRTNSIGLPIDVNGLVVDGPNTRLQYVDKFESRTVSRQVSSGKGSPATFGKNAQPASPSSFTTVTEVQQISVADLYPDSHWDAVARETNNGRNVVSNFPFSSTSNISVRINTGNTETVPYTAPHILSSQTIVTSKIAKIEYSGFIRAKNAFEQPPLVRLYNIYYPGEWYPYLPSRNPAEGGTGLAWPSGFPYRFAEVRGDTISDISYRAYYDGEDYQCYPIESDGIGLNQDGEVNQVNVRISNFDSLIAQIVENSTIAGNCSNAISGTVNFEKVHNLDPATVVNSATYDQSIVDSTYAGISNSAITYDRCIKLNGTWTPTKQDSRDLLGGVVEIKSTFATFLDYWPEYSSIRSVSGNIVELYSTAPYRINDNVTIKGTRGKSANVKNIVGNFLELDSKLDIGIGTNLMIVNPDADPEAFVEDVFKVDKLSSLNGAFAEFSLTSWLQYFKLSFPRRKYYKNTCPWIYKGEECQYPDDGTGTIPGTSASTALTANGFWTTKNVQVNTVSANDECSKSFVACKLRHNQIHFGGFIGTGRTIPKG